MSDDVKALQRTIRQQKKALTRLSDVLLVALNDFDAALELRTDIPPDVCDSLARWANQLDMENDHVRYFALGVDHRTDDKERATDKARTRLRPPAPPHRSPR